MISEDYNSKEAYGGDGYAEVEMNGKQLIFLGRVLSRTVYFIFETFAF